MERAPGPAHRRLHGPADQRRGARRRRRLARCRCRRCPSGSASCTRAVHRDGPAEPADRAGRRSDLGRVVAFQMSGTVDRPPHTIWMDGRPHPSKSRAAHRRRLHDRPVGGQHARRARPRTSTTGIVWRNGVPHSDQATMTEPYVRHGNILTVTMIVEDPVYFEEPFIRNASFEFDPAGRVLPEPCEPQVEIPIASRARCRTTCRAPIPSSTSRRGCSACRPRRRAAGPGRCIRSTSSG